jgi:dTDP-6-deoxy-L-talose 4-dehydrogenase (NAD+)
MKRMLVTGAGGYIGQHVVSTLLDMGYAVSAVDVRPFESDARADAFVCDIFSNSQDLYETFLRPDCVYHLAWKDGFIHNAISHLEFLPLHYTFIENLVKAGCKSVTVMGSMHEIGYHEGAIDENTPQNPSSLYGISKNALRQALFALQKTLPFSFHWLRGYYICGDDKNNNSIFSKILQKAQANETLFPFTSGTNQYDFIDVNDLALEIALAGTQDEIEGIVNCSSGKPVALKDKVETFIADHRLNIKLQYGAFPDRPYDSKIVYGDAKRIRVIAQNACGKYPDIINARIDALLSVLAD